MKQLLNGLRDFIKHFFSRKWLQRRSLRVAIVCGEHSGDLLGAGLIRAIKKRKPKAVFYGIAGPRMIQAGCEALYAMERLAVMGFVEPLMRLPELFNIRRKLRRRILKDRPDVFIGIDAPEFNLGLEVALRKAGIKTVHYVSPSVWAWREKRVHKIKRAADFILTLFPFEESFYQRHDMPAKCVGHPLADQIPLEPDRAAARRQLGLSKDAKLLAILPGSRRMEIKRLAKIFIQAAQRCASKIPDLQIITAMVSDQRSQQFQNILKKTAPNLPVKIFTKQSHQVMEAADVVLLASGTATLETMLYKRPMAVGYRLSGLGFWIAKKLVKTPYVALPNILARREVVPEFLQAAATPEALSEAVLHWFDDETARNELIKLFHHLHLDLKRNADDQAAEAILQLIGKK